MFHPSRTNAESTMGEKQGQNPFEATALEANGELPATAEEMNYCETPEIPIYPAMDALRHLSRDATQLSREHLSPLKPDVDGNVTSFGWPFSRSDGRSHPLTIQPRLALPDKHKVPQDRGSQLFAIPPPLEVPDTPPPTLPQLQHRQKGRQNRGVIQQVYVLSPAEESISRLDTMLMFAVRAKEIEKQQQNIFVNTVVEDITYRDTLRLHAITLTSGQQVEADQRQAVASTAGGAAIVGIGDLISTALRFATNIVMTNTVSQSVYGTFVTSYTCVTILGFIAGLGMDSAMLRFLSIYRAKGEHAFAAGLIRFVVWITLISGLLCGGLFFLSATVLAHFVYHVDAYELPFKESALLIPFIALQLTLASGLQALKATKWRVCMDRLLQPGLTLVLIAVFYLLGLRLEALILATICGFLTSVITGQFLLNKASKQLINDALPKFEVKTWLRFSLPMFFSSMIQNILNSTDILFLAAFAASTQVGLYAAADRASLLVVMPLLALNTIFSPLIAEYYVHEKHKQLASMSKVVTKWAFSLSLPVFLCFCIFHDFILSIFAREYMAAGTVLIVLSFGNLVDAGVGSVGYLLIMTGRARVVLVNTVITITLNIGLGILLVPRFNVIGAAVAAALTVIISNVMALIEVYCILRIFPWRWDMLKSVVAGGVASIVGLLLLHVFSVSYGYLAILEAFGLVIPFMLVYVLTLALLGFSKEDMMVFDAVLIRIGKKKSV